MSLQAKRAASSAGEIGESTTDRLRAALVTAVLLWQVLLAIPLPPKFDPDKIDNKRALRTELDRWHGLISSLGVEVSRHDLAGAWSRFGDRLRGARRLLVAPGQPLAQVTRTGQGWGLFAIPDEWPNRLLVEVEEGGSWRTFYRRGELEPGRFHGLLRHRRVRAVYDTVPPTRATNGLCVWLAEQVLAEVEAATSARLVVEKSHTVPPGEAPDPAVTRRTLCTTPRDPTGGAR